MSQCPSCASWHSKVKETRPDTRFGWRWRLRDCSQCDHRWSTYEVDAEGLSVDGQGDPNGKLIR